MTPISSEPDVDQALDKPDFNADAQNDFAKPLRFAVAAIAQIRKALQQESKAAGNGALMLRVGVIGGGCAGLEYRLDFVGEKYAYDFVFEVDDITVVVDHFSAGHLRGTLIDYNKSSLLGSGFVFNNPNVSRSCGCGSSFQT